MGRRRRSAAARESLLRDLLPGRPYVRVAGDGGQEVGSLERTQARVDDGSDCRRSGDVAEQRDLAEMVACAGADAQSPSHHLELAVPDERAYDPRAEDAVTAEHDHSRQADYSMTV